MYKLARQMDYDRTLAANYARAPAALYALIAFQAELGAIRGKVSDPITFEMRLMWWREAIKGVTRDQTRKHPIMMALAPHIRLGELDEGALDVMVQNRFSEFFEPAKNFQAFVEGRRNFLQPFYANTCLALGREENLDAFNVFLAFDVLGCLQHQAYYKALGITPFDGDPDQPLIKEILQVDAKTLCLYFQGLRALAIWHFKRLEKVSFNMETAKAPKHHPGKIIALWGAKRVQF